MASVPTEIVIKLDEEATALLLNLLAALTRLAAALEQGKKAEKQIGPYLQ